MKFTEFTERCAKMCDYMKHCAECPFYPHIAGNDINACLYFCFYNPTVAISLLQIWEKENPYLEKCPFCGGNSKIETSSNGTLYFVNCVSCRAAACASTEKEKAVEKWNRRAATE